MHDPAGRTPVAIALRLAGNLKEACQTHLEVISTGGKGELSWLSLTPATRRRGLLRGHLRLPGALEDRAATCPNPWDEDKAQEEKGEPASQHVMQTSNLSQKDGQTDTKA